MFTLNFSGHGLFALEKSPKGCNMNTQWFCDVAFKEVKRSVRAISGQSGIEGLMIPLDNCKVYNSAKSIQRLEEFQVIRLPLAPYSPDMSPCDFWFFGWSRDTMKGHQFRSADHVRAFLVDLWSNLDQSTLISVYEGWMARLEEVIATNVECYSPSGI
jgi:hypothetical protein